MDFEHTFTVSVEWRGNRGAGTSDPRAFGRASRITTPGAPPVEASAARPFHGDADRWNPETLLLAALAECHMLSYLSLAARSGIRVEEYRGEAECSLAFDGARGRITEATLRPRVVISAGDREAALALHDRAQEECFIAASVAFPVRHEAEVELRG